MALSTPKLKLHKSVHACGYDLDEAELEADTCSDCGAPLRLKQSVSIWATSVPKAGATVWGK
jgi:hypothetical protein